VDNKTIDDVREQILGEFDHLRKEGKKHTAARQSVIGTCPGTRGRG
jgi:hypothetical protein